VKNWEILLSSGDPTLWAAAYQAVWDEISGKGTRRAFLFK
jgi:hypothetical protein